jgi:hypothetical protein
MNEPKENGNKECEFEFLRLYFNSSEDNRVNSIKVFFFFRIGIHMCAACKCGVLGVEPSTFILK